MHFMQCRKLMILNTFFNFDNVLFDKKAAAELSSFIKSTINGGSVVTLILRYCTNCCDTRCFTQIYLHRGFFCRYSLHIVIAFKH